MLIQIILTAVPGSWQAPPIRRLARLLKAMLGGYDCRCVSALEFYSRGITRACGEIWLKNSGGWGGK
jgi:hypothetical protein